MPYGGYGYGYKPKVKGDFKPGDQVRVKSEFLGATYVARAKRQGVWIVDKFLSANWELKRPDDAHVPYGYPKRLRAKPHQIEKVEDTPKPPATKHLLSQPQVNEPQVNDIKKDIVTLRPGTVVLVKHPDYPGQFKGLYAVIENSHTGLTWVAVAPLFGGAAQTVKTEYITVIPQQDLTITYKPK